MLPRQVEAAGRYKYQRLIPVIDHSPPSARGRDSENTQPSVDREKALKASRKQPISQAEAGTSREEMISRGKRNVLGRIKRTKAAGEPFGRKNVSTLNFASDTRLSTLLKLVRNSSLPFSVEPS